MLPTTMPPHMRNFFIEHYHCHVLVPLGFLPQDDIMPCLTNMCRVKDPDCAPTVQFHRVHELYLGQKKQATYLGS
jgi:hypothetical protein